MSLRHLLDDRDMRRRLEHHFAVRLRRAKALMRKDPNLTVAVARAAWPFRPAFMEQLADGLASAGIPRA